MSVSTVAHPVTKPPLRGTKRRPGFLSTWPGRILVIVIVAAIAGGAILWYRSASAPAPVTYRTQAVTRTTVAQTVSVPGTVNPAGEVPLTFAASGRLAELSVSVGETVAAGQTIALLDTTDLENALATAQQNLGTAQANYQKQVLASSDTRQALSDAQTSADAAIAAAEATLARLQTNYAGAKTNLTMLTNAATSDLATYRSAIDALRTQGQLVLNDISVYASSDVNTARTSLYAADTSLGNAQAYAAGQTANALAGFVSARDALLSVAATFDSTLSANGDTNAQAVHYQTVLLNYNVVLAQLSAVIDTLTGMVTAAQTSVNSASGALNTNASRANPSLDQARGDILVLQNLFVTDAQLPADAKTRTSQAATPLATITDAVSGSLVNAIGAIANAQTQQAAAVRNAESAVANIPLNLQTAYATVQSAQAALAIAQTNLGAAALVAPTAGVITAVNGTIGQNVAAGGATAFATIASASAVTLHGTVGEANVGKLKLGQDANVTIDALGTGAKITGKVSAIDFVATISSGVPVYGVDVTIAAPPASIKSGMTGTAQVIQASKSNVLAVPNLAIRTKGGTRYVEVMRNGIPTDTTVTFGITNGTITEVTSGLNEGDEVVLPQPTTPSQTPGGQNIPGIRF